MASAPLGLLLPLGIRGSAIYVAHLSASALLSSPKVPRSQPVSLGGSPLNLHPRGPGPSPGFVMDGLARERDEWSSAHARGPHGPPGQQGFPFRGLCVCVCEYACMCMCVHMCMQVQCMCVHIYLVRIDMYVFGVQGRVSPEQVWQVQAPTPIPSGSCRGSDVARHLALPGAPPSGASDTAPCSPSRSSKCRHLVRSAR